MKKPDISRWNYNANMECLLLFANIVDETTFNYTTDSYKASALHSLSLMDELLSTIKNIDRGVIREQALESVVNELNWSIDHDEVIKELISEKKLSGLVPIINPASNRIVLKNAIEMLLATISVADYLHKLKETISELVKNNRQKEKLERQARIFITHLKFMGYEEEYIYYKNKDFFFSSNIIINSENQIDDFLALFSGIPVEYKVIFIANNIAAQIQNIITAQGDEVGDDFNIGVNNNRVRRFKKKRHANWKFITISVKTMDMYAARSAAVDKMESLSNLFSFYHHKNTLTYQDVCMVVETANPTTFMKIKKPTPNIVRCKDLKPLSASRLFIKAASQVDMEPGSLLRIVKSLRLHQAALTADTLENQFVNLFTALEILIPKQADSGKDRILQIYETLIPYLCLGYYDKLVSSVVDSIKQWNPAMLTHIEQTVTEGTTTNEKVCAYMLLQKYDNDLDTVVYTALTADHYYLLRHRMNRLHVLMEKPSELTKHLKHHEQKLKWHIDRIYRTRNLIVHSGAAPYYLETLLENIHSYYDILITRLIHDNIGRGFKKLEYSYLMYDVDYKGYLDRLSKLQTNGDQLDENNILDAVLLQN